MGVIPSRLAIKGGIARCRAFFGPHLSSRRFRRTKASLPWHRISKRSLSRMPSCIPLNHNNAPGMRFGALLPTLPNKL